MAFHVLIVDDSPVMRAFIRRVITLSGLDAQFSEAANGQEALAVLDGQWVDVVLTDLNMPVMNGEQLVRSIQKRELLRAVPVVVVSTDATEARSRQMRDLGARGYVRKPFGPERLRAEIERVLGVARA